MRARVAHMKDPVLEVLIFSVGGVRYGIPLSQVVGLVKDIPHQQGTQAPIGAQCMLFEGIDVPVFPAADFIAEMGPHSEDPREVIIFDDGQGMFGMAIDGTDSVIGVTPGSDLYVLPPQDVSDLYPCRPWGVLTHSEKPVLLLDMSRVTAH